MESDRPIEPTPPPHPTRPIPDGPPSATEGTGGGAGEPPARRRSGGRVRSAYAVHRPVENEWLVRERDRRRHRDLAKILALLSPVALALLFFTWTQIQVLDSSYRIDELERELHRLDRLESQLRLEASHLSSPSLLEERARRELGLVSPPLDRVLYYQPGEAR